ncbi:protein phosphatase 1 regulatory subunit 15B [Dunckerocampus dactyliophorus]|uniref:protein phosphatase 1 regulatory subunit 15B n=1 Tax=Dunckerocampus dactyliophorus TaxID=161453 RepID=UPI0024062246|nr:protein phosphatase 1 regulatory subunit 15B [Dunckerocampus dactyliophorus]XP_054640919.1 protein phosphatase 1 regulatory subunit 15B [Dunckerocampus dactyliophorus]
MFGNRANEGQLPCGQSLSSPAGLSVASAGLESQESPWIGLLSVLSRPALSFLHKYLPGFTRIPSLADGSNMNSCLVDEQGALLGQLVMPLSQHPVCPAGLLEPRTATTLSWLSGESLREVDIHLSHQPEATHKCSSGNHSLSSQDMKPGAGTDWLRSRTWWSSFFGGDMTHAVLLSHLSRAELGTAHVSPQRTTLDTKESHGMLLLDENAGVHTEDTANNDRVQNRGWSAVDHQVSIGAACCVAGLLARDQDNGYSSLEEEHAHVLLTTHAPAGPSDTTEEAESEENVTQGEKEGSEPAVTPHHCQNKSIAFIMGCPCSDDDVSSQSDDDDDDGFDSEGSSGLSDSTDEDDEASDSDGPLDPEAERLLTSLCRSRDPYNLRNFTAPLHTGRTPPHSLPATSPPSSTQSTPASSPNLTPAAALSLASSPPSGHDTWDDSTSASEVDEAESLRLLSSFASSDPYSLFNFQAPIGTAGSAQGRTASKAPTRLPRRKAQSPPASRKEENVEKLDSSLSELSTSSGLTLRTAKKVRFSDRVEEFFASCGEEEEDRKGPWEELARDRCRFLRRCQEVELSIAYCLQPRHRRLAYRRLATQDA